MSKTPFLILSFLDFVVFVVRNRIFLKSEEMCDFFRKRGYATYVDQAGIIAPKENNDRIPFTFTFHPHNATTQ